MAESPRESNGEGDQSREGMNQGKESFQLPQRELIGNLISEGLLPSKLRESSWARYRRNRDFLSTCKFGCLQYVIIKVLFALMTCILGGLKSNFRLSNVYLYMTVRKGRQDGPLPPIAAPHLVPLLPGLSLLLEKVVSNFSQTWALYCMVLFYHCFKDELAKWRPIGKFLCVKAVVFFTWWQAVRSVAHAARPTALSLRLSCVWYADSCASRFSARMTSSRQPILLRIGHPRTLPVGCKTG
eukprot:scaffold2171_cov253-Pinguiococcus_pyrenoidosus.AAC.8